MKKAQCDVCDGTENNFVCNKNNRNDIYGNTLDN